MEQQAATLLSTLKRPAAPSDQKVALLNALKSDIKHYRVPETALTTVFECLRLAISQQSSSTLASSAFSTLGHLIKRLRIQDPSGNSITHLGPRILVALQERLGDLREPVRTAAAGALGELWPYAGGDVERIIREEAIGGSHVRAKETGIAWVVKMHKEDGMPFKNYVPSIVVCLEESDGNVRDAAKTALVELFASASDGAKTDLKKQLKAHSVRHSIETQILAQIGGSGAAPSRQHMNGASQEAEGNMASSTRSLPPLDNVSRFAESINSEAAQPPPQEVVQMDPLYVHSERELRETFEDMLPHFEGKETEQNWMPRDKSILKLRRLLKGNAPSDYHHAFMAGIKSTTEGIVKVSTSLRTTMSTNGCQLVQELARTLGPALDPHLEIFLQTFIKMSSATKHIAAENGRITADAIFQNCSYNARMMQHIWAAAQEKNAQTRQCVPAWMKTILTRQASYKSHFDSSGGLELAEKCIKKGLEDANPKVKEGIRATYWLLAKNWPEKAEAIINKLDDKTRTALERDSNNPNAALHSSQVASAAPSGRRTAQSSRSALRELMAEQRKAKMASQNMPDRASSAMATLSPSKPKPELGSASRGQASKLKPESKRVVSTASNTTTASSGTSSSTAKGSSLMSGPVRRPRRPEIQRPQTADPYASRKLLRPETPANNSPKSSPTRGTDASKTSAAPTSASRNRARTPAQGLDSREGSPVVKRSPMYTSRTMQDSKPSSKGGVKPHVEDSSTLKDDDFTMVLPSKSSTNSSRAPATFRRPALDKTMSVDSGLPAMAEDDGFTMVMPSIPSQSSRERLSLSYRSPLKAMFEDARQQANRSTSSSSKSSRPQEQPRADDPFIEPTPGFEGLPVRRGSPVKGLSSQSIEVQVYEDQSHSSPPDLTNSLERHVLSELPLNGNVRVQSPTHSAGSSASPASSPRHPSATDAPRSPLADAVALSTPQDRSELLRNRRLLESGIARIRARNLDAHGFRKLQDLARQNRQDLWEANKGFDELMAALLDFLQRGDSKAAVALRVQALGVVRALLVLQRKCAAAWWERVIVALLNCRREVEASNASSDQMVLDLQKTADEVVKQAPPTSCILAILDHLSSSSEQGYDSDPSPRATAMSLILLRQLLVSAKERKPEPDRELRLRLAHTTAGYLEDADAEVRKADVELACEVFGCFTLSTPGEDDIAMVAKSSDFWNAFKGVDEGRLGLLTYYIARRAKGTAQ